MREVLDIANSEGLKCEEYKLMKNERYLSDVPEKLSTASPDSIPPARVCFLRCKSFRISRCIFPLIISPTLSLSPKEVLIHFYYLSIRINISRTNTTN